MKKLLYLLFVLVSVAAVACGDSSTPEDDVTTAPSNGASLLSDTPVPASDSDASAPSADDAASGTGASETDTDEVADEVPASEFTEPLSGGVFRRLWADPPTLDPHLTSDTTSAGIVVEVFSGLVALNVDLQLVPDLAESWSIDDGVVYTFKLRPDATFHNGKPVRAEDFKWSLERAADPKTASPVADTYLNDIVGAMEYIEGDASEISGIKVIDDRTLQITIDAPKAYFLAKLTYPTAYVLDQETVENGGRSWWVDNPVGTGAFKLAEYRIGERIVLERNDDYYRELALLDSIVMNLAGGQAMAMYENDEIDITGVGLFDLDRVLDPTEPLNQELVIAPPGFSVSYIGFNTTKPPFDDPKFRQALNHAVDKELIATEVLSELVQPAYSVLPPGFPGYTDEIDGLLYDPDLAQQLLAESAYSDADSRPRIVVTVPGTGGTIGLDLEVILEMWKQTLGVEVEIQQVEWATYLEDLEDQKFQAFAGLGWEADYPDPQDFLDILFHTDSGINHGAYSNAAVDSVLEEARTEPDVLRRIELYHDAEQLIVNDAAWVPMWFTGERYALVKPNVDGYAMTPMIVPKLQEIRIGD
jgi:oligopeptide transport system substrate-binding protein